MGEKPRFRTVFISDLHLGARGARAEELCEFLKGIRCDTLYLVGDVIDMWRLKSRWYWPSAHNDVVRRILKMSGKGVRVVYVPGNHDEWTRQFVQLEFGGIELKPFDIHETADGRRLFVTHGDQFDLVVRNSRWLSMLGAVAYEWLIRFNRLYNRGRRLMGADYHSLSAEIKARVKSACTFISRFEETLEEEARRRGLDGVLCGHIHQPRAIERGQPREDGEPTTLAYYNCGDWVESCSALVEHDDGRIELVDGLEMIRARREAKAAHDGDGEGSADDGDDDVLYTPAHDPVTVLAAIDDLASAARGRSLLGHGHG